MASSRIETVGEFRRRPTPAPPRFEHEPIRRAWAALEASVLAELRELTSPFPLVILETVPGSPAVEKYLHEQMIRGRVRGEWFEQDAHPIWPTFEALSLISCEARALADWDGR